MTNFYDKGLEKFLKGQIAYQTDNIKAVLIDTSHYTVNLSTHEFLSDIPSLGQVAISPNMASKTTAAGVAGAASPYAFPTVTGAPCEAIAYYKDTGTASTSPLISYHDSAVSGLPVTPNGGDINIIFTFIFKL